MDKENYNELKYHLYRAKWNIRILYILLILSFVGNFFITTNFVSQMAPSYEVTELRTQIQKDEKNIKALAESDVVLFKNDQILEKNIKANVVVEKKESFLEFLIPLLL